MRDLGQLFNPVGWNQFYLSEVSEESFGEKEVIKLVFMHVGGGGRQEEILWLDENGFPKNPFNLDKLCIAYAEGRVNRKEILLSLINKKNKTVWLKCAVEEYNGYESIKIKDLKKELSEKDKMDVQLQESVESKQTTLVEESEDDGDLF